MKKAKSLNMLKTYVNDVWCLGQLDVRYRRRRIAVTRSAMQELLEEGKDIQDVLKVLEEGYYAPRKRKQGIIEKWLDKSKKTFNAVIVEDYDEIRKEPCWALIHFGKFTRKKTKK